MSTHRYSTALSHIFLAGTGIYCWTRSTEVGFHLIKFSFGVVTVNSLIGIWRWGNPDYGEKVDGCYKFTTVLQTLFTLPCITAAVWLHYNTNVQLAYAHPAFSLLPFVAYALSEDGREENELTSVIVLANCISLCAISFVQENYYGLAAALSFAVAHLGFGTTGTTVRDIPSVDLYNYTLCFFTYFALKALRDLAV